MSYNAIYWAEHSRDQKHSKGIKSIKHCLGSSDCYSIIGRWGRNYGTTLHAASLGGHKRIVQMLLDKRADVNALQAASSQGHSQVVQVLLDKRADVHARVVQMLLNHDAVVSWEDTQGRTPFHLASTGGRMKINNILSNFRADLTVIDTQ